jgi:hypothetical protein
MASKLNMSSGRFDYLMEKYKGQITHSVLKSYKDADEYVLINEDKHLHPIWIKLPSPPELHLIDGFGLPAEKQYFTPAEMPKKLQKLIESCQTVDEVWSELEDKQVLYRNEIAFIKRQWEIYEKGYWCFINGKPTFIDGWHYIYCSWWRFKNGGRPEYRDRNRKFFHAMKYAYTTTETIKYDEHGKIVYKDPELKIPEMVDRGFRTVLGIAYPKHRKDGASNMCICAEYMETITHMGVVGGIISMTGNHAKEKLFDEILVPGWNQMPFFFKPYTTSNQNPSSEILFNAARARANKINSKALGSKLSYSETAESTLYDGGNNIWITTDEAGKTKTTDVFLRHRQLKPCVSLGNGANIFGFLAYPSTVGEMEGSGGKQFFKVCQDSKFEKRDLSGQTKSGMLVLYMPAYEGLDGFIGPYGESVVDDPTPQQAAFIGKDYGAKAHLESKRQQLLLDGDVDGYNEEVRLFPTAYMECFRTTDGDTGFNTKLVNERLEDLAHNPPPIRRGNFRWQEDEKDTLVVWEDDPKGRFELSMILPDELTNRYTIRQADGAYHKFPEETKFIASADPYKFEKTEGGRMSMGGGSVFYDFDEKVDSREKPIEYWKSYRFVCTYLNRPPKKEDYGEDMLMMCIYFGAMMNPEINVPFIWDHFEARGYGGYLWYEIDPLTNKKSTTPGFNSYTTKKQKIFSDNRDYIELHAKRCDHIDLLNQWKDISSIDEMTDYDLIPCAGGCLMAAKGVGVANQFKKKNEQEQTQQTMDDIYPMMVY